MTNTLPLHDEPRYISTLPGRKRDRIRLVKSFPGLQNHVALALGKHRSQVSAVVHKRDTSRPIEQALIAELNKRIAEQASNSENPAA